MAVKTQEQLLEEREAAYPTRSVNRYTLESGLLTDVIDTMFAIPAGIPNYVIVDSADDLSGTLDSNSLYLITGAIDMGSTVINVPDDGISISGYSFNVSELFSTENNYSMFQGGGTVVLFDCSFRTEGTNSRVFDLKGTTGTEATNWQRVNFNQCTSLGVIEDYRQHFETNTGRFGGNCSLEFAGTWLGGATITSSIALIDDGSTDALWKAGAGLTFGTRFVSDANTNLGDTAALTDFSPSNFVNASALQFNGAIVSRNGTQDPTDSTLTPNISASDLQSNWKNNVGLNNTYEGGRLDITTDAATTNPGAGVFADIAGTWGPSNLVHFTEPSNGRLQHNGTSPREYSLFANLTVEAGINNELTVRVVKFNGVSDEVIESQTAQVTFTVFSQDVARFTINTNLDLDEGDNVRLQIANESNGIADMTALDDSYFFVRER